ncbi:MAG: hypothetical protein ACK53A_10225 [Gemmatimonadota bacterium]|jgi:hypothetical protein|nr:hypothetical protein [Gemmatimonadota bacterium]
MIARLAFAHLAHRPWRSALLFGGFGLGVGVMIVLLSIGEAMMAQARDERLVGGGAVTVLPEGLDVEMLKTGGVGGMWFSIANARFVHRQLLTAPRLGDAVVVAAPQVSEKLAYLRAGGRTIPVRAIGEIPSASAAAGAVPPLAEGTWADDEADRAWLAPTPAERLHQMDRLHHVPAGVPAAARRSWAEWHYANVVSDDGRQRLFVTVMLVGDVPQGEWGAQVLVSRHDAGRPVRRWSRRVPASRVHFDTTRADLDVGDASVRVTPEGTYEIRARADAEGGGAPIAVSLTLVPEPRQYFPGADLGGQGLVSGYAVPVLRGRASGTACSGGACFRFANAQGYHDHNWGVWCSVNWEWGASRAGDYTFLYGRVQQTDRAAASAPVFFYLVDSLGFRALFRPQEVEWTDDRTWRAGSTTLRVPSRGRMVDIRGRDTLVVELLVDDVAVTDTRRGLIERGETAAARTIAQPWFLQLAGRARLRGRVDGTPIAGEGRGFFETYR